jgi:hypothetical protein
MIVLVNKFRTNLNVVNPNPHPHLESAFGMRIPDAHPEDQNHADPRGRGCGSATLLLGPKMVFLEIGYIEFNRKSKILC